MLTTPAVENREIKSRLAATFPGWKFSVTGGASDVQVFAQRVKPTATAADGLAATLRGYGFINSLAMDSATANAGGFRRALRAAGTLLN